MSENGFTFEIHGDVQCTKKILNIDFVIPNSQDPKIIIETFAVLNSKSLSSLVRIRELDHKFQMLKLKHPNVKTILAIKFMKPIILERVHRFIEEELLNTDILLINEEIKQLPQTLRTLHPSSTPSAFGA